ncbi:cytochrome P450 [Amycolatopsis sp. NPDC003865]
MTTPREQAEAPPNDASVTMRRALPDDFVQRGKCPFDPPPALLARREQAALQRLDLMNGASAWLVTGLDEARAIMADPRFSADRIRFPDAGSLTPQQVAERAAGGVPDLAATERTDGTFLFMDPPEHTRLRRLLSGQFTVRRMRALEEHIREIAVERIDAMLQAGTEADLVPAYAQPIPSQVICELLGVDYGDRAQFQESSATVLNTSISDDERAQAAIRLYAFITDLINAKRADPGNDIISGLVHDPEAGLTDAQLIDLAMLVLGAGHETTANMLALSTFALLENPEQLAALRADPSLLDGAIEELLRYLTIVQLGLTRVATEDVTIAGVDIAAGTTVVIGAPVANRDPRHWDAPDRLDVRRPRVPHLAFGHGIHQCMGQQLARVEMKVGLHELISRLPNLRLAVPADQVPLRDEMVIFGVHALPVTWS